MMIWDTILLETNCRIVVNALKQCIYTVQIMELQIKLLDPSKQLQNKNEVTSLIHFKCLIVHGKIISLNNPESFSSILLQFHCAVRNSPGSTDEKELP